MPSASAIPAMVNRFMCRLLSDSVVVRVLEVHCVTERLAPIPTMVLPDLVVLVVHVAVVVADMLERRRHIDRNSPSVRAPLPRALDEAAVVAVDGAIHGVVLVLGIDVTPDVVVEVGGTPVLIVQDGRSHSPELSMEPDRVLVAVRRFPLTVDEVSAVVAGLSERVDDLGVAGRTGGVVPVLILPAIRPVVREQQGQCREEAAQREHRPPSRATRQKGQSTHRLGVAGEMGGNNESLASTRTVVNHQDGGNRVSCGGFLGSVVACRWLPDST